MEVLRKLPEECINLSNAEVAVRVVPGTKGRFWRTLDVVDYMSPEDGLIVVDRGFITDFASIPRPLWTILPPFGQYTVAAVIHDYLYCAQDRPRWKADRVFLHAMEELDVRPWKRRAMFRAVRMFGDRPWRNKVTSKQQDMNL